MPNESAAEQSAENCCKHTQRDTVQFSEEGDCATKENLQLCAMATLGIGVVKVREFVVIFSGRKNQQIFMNLHDKNPKSGYC